MCKLFNILVLQFPELQPGGNYRISIRDTAMRAEWLKVCKVQSTWPVYNRWHVSICSYYKKYSSGHGILLGLWGRGASVRHWGANIPQASLSLRNLQQICLLEDSLDPLHNLASNLTYSCYKSSASARKSVRSPYPLPAIVPRICFYLWTYFYVFNTSLRTQKKELLPSSSSKTWHYRDLHSWFCRVCQGG